VSGGIAPFVRRTRGVAIRVEHAALALIVEPPSTTVAGEPFVLVVRLEPAGRNALVEARVSRNGDPAERLAGERVATTQDFTLRHPGFSPGDEITIDIRGYEGGLEVPAEGDEANARLEFRVPAPEDALAGLAGDVPLPDAPEPLGVLLPSARRRAARRVIDRLAARGVTSRGNLLAGGDELLAAMPARDRKITRVLRAHAALSALIGDPDERDALIAAGFDSPVALASTPPPTLRRDLRALFPEERIESVHRAAVAHVALARHVTTGTAAVAGGYAGGCGCDDCEAATSPLAYLVDLAQYVAENVEVRLEPMGLPDSALNLQALADLLQQPLGDLVASCASVSDPVRKVRLVVETLRRHLASTVPADADVICGPFPLPLEFIAAGDVDGDGRDELIVVFGADALSPLQLPDGVLGGLWAMDFDPRTRRWSHLRPMDDRIGADVLLGSGLRARAGCCGDVDGDGRDELILTVEDGAGVRSLWILDFDPQRGWDHLNPDVFAAAGTDLAFDVTGEVLAVFPADVDGDGEAELVVALATASQPNAFWVFDLYRAPAGVVWRALSPNEDAALPAFECDPPAGAFAGYRPRLAFAADVDQNGRDEIVAYPDAPAGDGRAGWVMIYDPPPVPGPGNVGTWRHINAANAGPLSTDLPAPWPLPVRPAHAFAAATRGLNTTALVLATEDVRPARPTDPNRFYEQRYDAAGLDPWLPADEIDAGGGNQRVAVAFGADVDGDLSDELVAVIDADGRRSAWVMERDAGGAWSHLSPIAGDSLGADLRWSAGSHVFGGALAADVDRSVAGAQLSQELVFYGTRSNEIWVLGYDAVARAWGHLSPVLPADLEARYLSAAYQALLAGLGTSLGELRAARGASRSERLALADRLGIPLQPDPAGPETLRQLLIAPADLTEAWLEEMFGLADTTRDPLSSGPVFDDPRGQVRRIALEGAVWSANPWIANVGSEGDLLVGLARVDASTVSVRLRRPDGLEVVSGQGPPGGRIRLSGGLSGLAGYVDLAYSQDTTTIRLAVVPRLEAWRQRYLRDTWDGQDQPPGRFAPWPPADTQPYLPAIDPDVVGPDDIRSSLAKAAGQPDGPFDLWLRRRGWVDAHLDAPAMVQHDLDAMLATLRPAGGGAAVPPEDFPWADAPAVTDFPALADAITRGPGTVGNAARDTVLSRLWLPVDAFLRLVELAARIRDPNVTAAEADWAELRSLLLLALKRRRAELWRNEEEAAGIAVDLQWFVPAARPPAEGVWPPPPPEQGVWIDPEAVELPDLPVGSAGTLARGLWRARRAELDAQAGLIRGARADGLEPMLVAAFGARPAGPWRDRMSALALDLQSADTAVADAARAAVQTEFALDLGAFGRLAALEAKLAAGQPATETEWLDAEASLITAHKARVELPAWRTEEQALGGQLAYWHARRAALPRWRALGEDRAAFDDELARRSRAAVVDPHRFAANYLRSRAFGEPVSGLYAARRTWLLDREGELRAVRTGASTPLSQFDHVLHAALFDPAEGQRLAADVGERRAARGIAELAFEVFGLTSVEVAGLNADLGSADAEIAAQARQRVASELWLEPADFQALAVIVATPAGAVTDTDRASFDLIVAGAELTGRIVAAPDQARSAGLRAAQMLARLGLTAAAHELLLRARQVAIAGEEIPDDTWDEVVAIGLRAVKERRFGAWQREELGAQPERRVRLGPDAFLLAGFDAAADEGQPRPWLVTVEEARTWRDTLEARIEVARDVTATARAAAARAEEATLPLLRDTLLEAVSPPGRDASDWASDAFLIDAEAGICEFTTRAAHAIDTILALLWSLRTGQLRAQYPQLILTAPAFDEDWRWIGSYVTWRSAVLVRLYPQNLLRPPLRRHLTPVLADILRELRDGSDVSSTTARRLAGRYADYFRDVCSLDLSRLACARVAGWAADADEGTRAGTFDFLFAASEASGALYWSTYELGPAAEQTGYAHGFWQALDGLPDQAVSIVGATTYRPQPPGAQASGGQGWVYLFLLTRGIEHMGIAFTRYNLTTRQWEAPQDLEAPSDATFSAWIGAGPETRPPTVLFESSRRDAAGNLRRIVTRARMDGKGTAWDADGLQELELGPWTQVDGQLTQAPRELLVLDADGNGVDELAAVPVTDGRIEFFAASPAGIVSRTGQTARSLKTGALVCAGDFDADGADEIVWNVPPDAAGNPPNNTTLLVEKRTPIGWQGHFVDPASPEGASARASSEDVRIRQLLAARLASPVRDQILMAIPASLELINGASTTTYTGTYAAFFAVGLTSTGYVPNAPWIIMPSPDFRTLWDRRIGAAFSCSPEGVAAGALALAADFDGDGRDELVYILAAQGGGANVNGSVGNDFWALDWRRNGAFTELGAVGNANLDTVGDFSSGPRPVAGAIAADIDGDGRAELIALPYMWNSLGGQPAAVGSRIWVAKFRPGGGPDPADSGAWELLPELDLSRELASVAHIVAADVDGDGADELFLFGTGRTWARKFDPARGTWSALPDPLLPGVTVALAAAGRFLPDVPREQVIVSFGTLTPEQQEISVAYNLGGDVAIGSRYVGTAGGPQIALLALTEVPDIQAQPQCSHTGINPTYRGGAEDWVLDDRANLDRRRLRTRQAFTENDGAPASVMTYLWEAFYALPVALALAQQRSGDYVHALDWFRLAYDYTRPLEQRKTFYGLVTDEQSGGGPEFGASLLEWLHDPLDVTALAMTRPDTWTRGTIQLIVSCLLDGADAEFTADTAESIERARLLYQSALRLLELDVMNERYDGCADVIGRVAARFGDLEEQRLVRTLGAELASALGERALGGALEQVAAALADGGGAERARQLVAGHLASTPPPPTLADAVAGAACATPADDGTAVALSPELTASVRSAWGASSGADLWFCVSPNPLLKALRLHAELGLYKIRSCRSIDGLQRPLDFYSGATDQQTGLPMIGVSGELTLPGAQTAPPTPYRYAALIERAKDLTRTAQQLEALMLAAKERRDQEAYTLLQARQAAQVARETVRLSDLQVRSAQDRILLSQIQQERAQVEQDFYSELLAAGDSELERDAIDLLEQAISAQNVAAGFGIAASLGYAAATVAYAAAAYQVDPAKGAGDRLSMIGQSLSSAAQAASSAGGVASTLASIRSTQSQIASMRASLEQTRQDWQLRQRLAAEDLRIGLQQGQIETDGLRVAEQERTIAQLQADHADQLVDYLTTKFTNVELYDWMSEQLQRAYATVLQHATSTARMAASQLAFERQGDAPGIAADYWTSPPDTSGTSGDAGPDRLGLTGAERLLADLVRLDQFAFETSERKLQLTKAVSLALLAPLELERLRATGVMSWSTPAELFDRDFPGHYLRLVKRAAVSLIALVTPPDGMHATLSATGTSRVVVGPDVFQEIIVRRPGQSVALTSPIGATGLFTFESDSALANPFELEGVDTTWELRMPRAGNRFDFRTIADVVFTIDYTAVDSFAYRDQVVRRLDRRYDAERAFSLRNDFPDAWWELHNPEQSETPLAVALTVEGMDFPPNVDELMLQHVALAIVSEGAAPKAMPVRLRLTEEPAAGGRPVTPTAWLSAMPVEGLISTRQANAGAWLGLLGRGPVGRWQVSLPDRDDVREWIATDAFADIVLVLSYGGRTPAWPA